MKVLIVDDEQIIRQGIKTFIPWEELGCLLIGEASNGIEALEIMKENPADIIVSDIRMPLMDGLDLSRELNLRYPHSKVILLTGYEDFEYAKRALKYKVVDYLLKPVGDDELAKVLQTTVGTLENEKKKRSVDQTMKDLVNKNKRDIQIGFIEKLIHGEVPGNLISGQYDDLSLNLSGDGFYQIIILFPEQDLSVLNLPEGSFEIPYLVDGLDSSLVLLDHSSETGSFFTDLNKLAISGAVGSRVSGLADISRSFDMADRACDSRCYLRSPALIHYSDCEYFRDKFLKTLPGPMDYREIELRMAEMFHTLKPQIDDLISRFLHRHILDNSSREDFIRYCRRLYNLSVKEAERTGIKLDSERSDPFSGVSGSDRWAEILKKTEVLFLQLEKYVLAGADNQYSPLTSQVISYIERHFKEDISLREISERTGVTESHISRVFKKETGINFVPWVNRFRIEYSLDLLASGEYKLYDIADLSGFGDYKYYTRQFKRFMGISPTEYQKNLFAPGK